ncbi:uncharacterized protein Dwil_GK15958 [Drosophila willistoni]|uniref:C-type lectin domain-containing protein n=1 Tax=Drosophila willistoni TaxID=7260 RepID=B4MS79_DROWI|nr:CRACD-like protein [Drosophila willistoni]EDW74968.1 uncharacterized protein Dwil_GK15958 [Drosophila willistoni]
MKYLVLGLLTLLSVLPKEQLLGTATACSRRYLRRINGKCYYFSVKKLNWYGALNNCLRKGLTLADLSNPADFYGAIGFLSSKGNTEDFWFSANDLQTEGRYQYASSGRLVKFFSNYSIVEPAEHSDCSDCLEVRIRSNLTVVADDSCLERQYFICSEHYCNTDGALGKPRHHSHEHLHHFHHDIGDEDEEGGEEPPVDLALSQSLENLGSNSEQAVAPKDLPDQTPTSPWDTDLHETTMGDEENKSAIKSSGEGENNGDKPSGAEASPGGNATQASPGGEPPSESATTPAAGAPGEGGAVADATTPAADAPAAAPGAPAADAPAAAPDAPAADAPAAAPDAPAADAPAT